MANAAVPNQGPGGAQALTPGAMGQSSGQPPFGASPATNPQASRGNEAQAATMVNAAVMLLSRALTPAGPTSEMGKAIMTCINQLSKFVPPGQVSPGLQQSQIQSLLARQQQMGPQIAQMRGGPPPSPAPAIPATPPGAV